MKVIQLLGVDGEPIGLYLTQRDDNISQIQLEFDTVFEEASLIAEDEGDDWDIMTYVDEKMENVYKVERVYSEEVTTDIL